MSRKSTGWRAAAKQAAKDYPRLRKELDALQGPAPPDGMPSSGQSRPTEIAVLRELDYRQQRRLEAVEHALNVSSQLTSGLSRVKLIEMIYFTRRYTIEGAAMQIPCSVQTAKIWNSDFLLLVWGRLKGK